MATQDNSNSPAATRSRRPLTIAAAVLIALVIFAIGIVAGHASYRAASILRHGPARFGYGGYRMGMMGGYGAGGMNVGANRITGVVTAVGSGSFTLAGGGASTTIQTNGSTQYSGGSSAAVNDTVTVLGTDNNGTWTAERVIINP